MSAKVRKIIMVFVCLCQFVSHLQAQQVEEVMRMVTGENDLENFDPEVLDAVYQMQKHPVKINSASLSALESTGLFTSFQLASLEDYKNRHGSVMSLNELSVIDGFTPDFAKAISPFIVVDTDYVRPKNTHKPFSTDIGLRGGYKYDPSKQVCKSTYAFRTRMKYEDKITLSLSATEPYDSTKTWPTIYTGNLTWQHRKGKVILGDFNARFGHGLCLWNTATFSSPTSPSAFMKRSTGRSASNSFTGSSALTGLAVDYTFDRWKASALVSLPRIKKYGLKDKAMRLDPSVNLARYFRIGHLAMTHNMSFSNVFSSDYRIPKMLSAADASLCIKGVNVFSEVAIDWVTYTPSAFVGVETGVGESLVVASLIRYVPASNEHTAALSGEVSRKSHRLTLSAEGRYYPVSKSKDGRKSYQFKPQVDWLWNASESLQVRLKYSERIRTWGNFFKTQVRAETRFAPGSWILAVRFDALYGIDFGCCGYAEGGYVSDKLSVYARYGMFMVDNWDDRIYVYERDAPGYFNVPALYGRGLWTSLYLVWKYAQWGSLYLRATYKNPGNAEVKLQCVLHF